MTNEPLTTPSKCIAEECQYGAVGVETKEEDVSPLEAPITMENVLQELGVPGRYQVMQLMALTLCVTPFSFVVLNFVFIGYEPQVTCLAINETRILAKYQLTNDDSMAIIDYDSCHATLSFIANKTKYGINIPCDAGYDYEADPLASMATEWNLLCDKRGVVELVQTALTLGLAVSSSSVSSVADRFGRKYVYMAAAATMITTEFGLYFANSFYFAIFLRFISGLSAGGMFAIYRVVSMELIVSKYRHVYALISCIWWCINLMLLSGVAFAFKHNWRHLQLAGALTGIPAFLAAFIVHETPISLLARGRIKEARQILSKACKLNKKNIDEIMKTALLTLVNSTNIDVSSMLEVEQYSFIDLFKNRKLMQITLVLGLTWFSNATTYYGLFLISSRLAGDRFLNFFLMALLEIPSSIVAMFLLVYVGRRTIVMAFMAIAGICMVVATTMIATGPVSCGLASTVFSLVGKFAIGASYNTLTLYTPELYPTTIRSTGYGICCSLADLGVMLAPFLNPIFKYIHWLPGALFSSLCFLSFIFLWKVPETKGRQLPNTVEEIKAWEKSL